jgi:hypothetical protein
MKYSEIKNANELKGHVSLTFEKNKTFEEFCENNFSGYDKERHEPIAIRLYYGKETIITLYAADKSRKEKAQSDRLPVKKFKTTTLSIASVLPFVKEFNFTLAVGEYSDNIEVINK